MPAPWKAILADERRLTAAFSLSYFLLIAAFTVAKIARDSLFLSELPAAYIPYMYVGLALLSALAAFALGRARKASAQRRLSVVLGATGLSLLVFTLWFLRAPGTAAIAFYLWTGVYSVVLVAEFWLFANERIDSRQARRLFGPIGAAGVLGGTLAAMATSALGPFIHTLWFLVSAGVLYVAAGVTIARATALGGGGSIPRTATDSDPDPESEEERSAEPSRYPRLLVVVFLFAGVTSAVIDYAFKVVLQGELGDSGKIASALGIFYSVQGVVSIVAQVGVTGALISRFGHRLAANVLPAGVLTGGLLAAILPVAVAPWALLGTKLYELTLRYSVAKTAWEFLYFPLSSESKGRVKRLVDVVVNRSADAVAGLLLLGLNFAFGGSLAQLAILLVILAVAWFVFDLRLNRAYTTEVDLALRRLVPEKTEPTEIQRIIDVEEPLALLGSDDESKVLIGLGVLERLDSGIIVREAPRLARHASVKVRARLLAILNAMGREIGPYAPFVVGPAPGAASPEVASLPAAVDERVVIAAKAGRSDLRGSHCGLLGQLLEDPNEDVRRTAILSAALLGARSRVPDLVARLSDQRDRRYASEALVLLGESIAGDLGSYLVDPGIAVRVRCRLIRVLEEIGGEAATETLYRASRFEGDHRVIDAALRSLLVLRRKGSEVLFSEEDVLRDLRQEIQRDGLRLVQLALLRRDAEGPLADFLVRVLDERADQSFLRVFRRLALIHPAGPVLSAHRGLRSGERQVRAQALDYLDTVLPGDLRRLLIPLMEASNEHQRSEEAARLFALDELTLEATLRQLLESREEWLRACALFVVGKLCLREYREAAIEAVEERNQVVRETALWAVRRLE